MHARAEQWRNKFLKHRDMDERKKAEIPFPFYRDSISLFQGDKDGGPHEERWKVRTSPHLAASRRTSPHLAASRCIPVFAALPRALL